MCLILIIWGLAISKNNHESKNVHMINSDKTILSIPHNATNILDTKSNHHSNTTTSNDKLVILTFGDTIKTKLLPQSRY
jgi:hypothetical protein